MPARNRAHLRAWIPVPSAVAPWHARRRWARPWAGALRLQRRLVRCYAQHAQPSFRWATLLGIAPPTTRCRSSTWARRLLRLKRTPMQCCANTLPAFSRSWVPLHEAEPDGPIVKGGASASRITRFRGAIYVRGGTYGETAPIRRGAGRMRHGRPQGTRGGTASYINGTSSFLKRKMRAAAGRREIESVEIDRAARMKCTIDTG